MNPIWQNFLLSTGAVFTSPSAITFLSAPTVAQRLLPLVHLGVLTVSGKDAATLLQGQITCNINDVTEGQSSWGAICNPKGRAFATFLLLKQADDFHLILPIDLLEKIKKRLSLFILRSIVTITDNSSNYCLIGVAPSTKLTGIELSTHYDGLIHVNFGDRSLILAEVDAATAFWSEHLAQGYQADGNAAWQMRDISSGIPWLNAATSEEFVPQMLNLDKIGGISFTKGCYTGQEIIARTHYLGKSKRGMVYAECTDGVPELNASVFNEQGEIVGHVLAAQSDGAVCKLQIVIQLAEDPIYQLKLAAGVAVTVLPFA